jgi:membrane fusion protein, heavy metal efflux system
MKNSARGPRIRFLLAAGAVVALLAASACSSGSTASDPASASTAVQAELVRVPKEQMAHIQVVTVQPSPWTNVLRLTGTVAYNGFQTTPVISQISGPVSRIVVYPGQYVKQGQPMLYVSSPDYSQLRTNFLKARDAHDLAHKNYARAKDLYDHHALAERDLQTAESAEVQAQADLETAEQSLNILGIPKPDTLAENPTSPEIAVIAPISGQAVDRLCAPGQVIQAGQTQCFTISDMSSVWVFANVYENQLGQVHVGDPVQISTDAYPTVFRGKISYLGSALDPASRTLQARIDVRNTGEKLKKDMYVTALVQAGETKNALAVPDSAVLRDSNNEPFVYVQTEPDRFARRSVSLGQAKDGKTQIVSGLQAGDHIAGDGSLFLQFETSLQ